MKSYYNKNSQLNENGVKLANKIRKSLNKILIQSIQKGFDPIQAENIALHEITYLSTLIRLDYLVNNLEKKKK